MLAVVSRQLCHLSFWKDVCMICYMMPFDEKERPLENLGLILSKGVEDTSEQSKRLKKNFPTIVTCFLQQKKSYKK